MSSLTFSITEHIPVADHVYKYLIKKCGSDTFVANRSHIIGHIVLNSLGKHNDLSITKPNFTKVFNVVINEKACVRNGFYVGVKSGQVFNNMIDKMFREELFTHLLVAKNLEKEKFFQSLRNFLEVYDITEDDIKYESLYRDFKRKKDHVLMS